MKSAYRRMLKGLNKKSKRASSRLKKSWSVYILRCQDDKFYTGISNDVERRLRCHNEGKGAKFTRTRLPVTLIYQENSLTRAGALIREMKIKSLSRLQKESLVAGQMPLRGLRRNNRSRLAKLNPRRSDKP